MMPMQNIYAQRMQGGMPPAAPMPGGAMPGASMPGGQMPMQPGGGGFGTQGGMPPRAVLPGQLPMQGASAPVAQPVAAQPMQMQPHPMVGAAQNFLRQRLGM